jgi:hypothetical protein
MSKFIENLKKILLIVVISLNLSLKRLNGQEIEDSEYRYYEKLVFDMEENDSEVKPVESYDLLKSQTKSAVAA